MVSSTLVGEENCGVVRVNSSRANCHLHRNDHCQTSLHQGGKSASDILTFIYRISIRMYRYFSEVGNQEQKVKPLRDSNSSFENCHLRLTGIRDFQGATFFLQYCNGAVTFCHNSVGPHFMYHVPSEDHLACRNPYTRLSDRVYPPMIRSSAALRDISRRNEHSTRDPVSAVPASTSAVVTRGLT